MPKPPGLQSPCRLNDFRKKHLIFWAVAGPVSGDCKRHWLSTDYTASEILSMAKSLSLTVLINSSRIWLACLDSGIQTLCHCHTHCYCHCEMRTDNNHVHLFIRRMTPTTHPFLFFIHHSSLFTLLLNPSPSQAFIANHVSSQDVFT